MRHEVGGAVQAFASATGDGLAEMLGVPVYDNRGQQIQPGHPEVLSLAGSVADFALAADPEGVLQGMVGFALVQTDLGTALHVSVEQPVDYEERPLDPSDFPQCHSQLMRHGCAGTFDDRRHRWRHH